VCQSSRPVLKDRDLNRDLGPRTQFAYQQLRDSILNRAWSPGTRLPSHRALAARLGVAVMTVRLALNRLEEEGLIVLQQGRGTFVQVAPPRPETSNGSGLLERDVAPFRLLFAENPHPMWVYDLETLRFLEVNDAAVTQYGYTRDEFLAMRITDIRPAEDVPRLLEDVEKERPAFDRAGVWQHRRKDGHVIDVEVTSHTLSFGGRPAALVLVQDISERKRAEDEHAHLAAIVESSQDAIIGKTLGGIITSWNRGAEQLYGYPSTEAVGQPIAMLVPPEHMDEVRGILERIRRGEHLDHYETVRHRKDGGRIEVSLTISPIKDAAGKITGASIIARDIAQRKQAERARAQQAALLDLANDAILVREFETDTILFWNQGAEHLYGIAGEEAMGKISHDVLRTIHPVPVQQLKQALLETGRWEGELIHTTQHGRRIVVDSRWAVQTEGDRPLSILEINTDATERKSAEDALRSSEERFRAIFEQAAVGMAIVGLDDRYLLVNQRLCTMTGYSGEELLTKTFHDITHPDDHTPDQAYGLQIRAGDIDRSSREKRYIRKDGSILWIALTVSMVRDASGQPSYFIAVMEDSTERKRAEESLQVEAQRLATVVATQQDIVHELDVDAIAQRVVDRMRELTGADGAGIGFIDGEDLVYRAATGLLPRGFRMPRDDGLTGICLRTGQAVLVPDVSADPRVHRQLAAALSVGSAILVPLPHGDRQAGVLLVNAARPGAFRAVDMQTLQLLAGQVGAVMSRAAAFQAQQHLLIERAERNRVLEREVAQRTAQLQTSNQELEAFAYSVSHDLRAPLRAIDGFSKVLQDRYGGALDVAARGYLERVRAASQKMSRLIDDLLQISRVTRQEMRISQVDLTALAASIATGLHESDPARAVEWVIEERLTARCDEVLLRVALENLLANAWKFTSKNQTARIEVGATHNNGTTIYHVRDDGAGFDMKYAGKMFAAFQRLHAASEFEGTGVGLATVQRIIHRHGGDIQAEGRPGEGATFCFTLETV